MTIKTDSKWKPFVYRHDLPRGLLKRHFDWIDSEDDDNYTYGFFRYRGYWYHLSEFIRIGYPGPFGQTIDGGWQASLGDSFFSGVLIKISDDGERYQVATYFS